MIKLYFFLLITFLSFAPTLIANNWEGKKSIWNGYDRYDFLFKDKKCFVVVPKKTIENKPWVWRSRWPGYHTEPDVLLLEQGYHIVHINTGGMFGSPKALEYWDSFYNELTQNRGLSKKVNLVAVSRGGLFAYRWASLNPTKVACIYGDVPVCDFKSWPLGIGKGIGDKKSWEKLLAEYNLTHEEALIFKKNPIDCLEPIAKQSISIFHIVSTNDKVVPAEENTSILAERYKTLGGNIKVLEVHDSKKANGHHFVHPNPQLVCDFILKNN